VAPERRVVEDHALARAGPRREQSALDPDGFRQESQVAARPALQILEDQPGRYGPQCVDREPHSELRHRR